MKEDNFINISFNINNLDRYVIRNSILKAINWGLPRMHGKLLDLGCGQMPYQQYILHHSEVTEYIGVDIESELGYHEKVKPDNFWDGKSLPFTDNTFDCIFCTEVLEHVPDTISFLMEAQRVLKPGGTFFFTTPFLWPLHDVPYDEYRLTPFSIKRLLNDAGLGESEISPLGGWHASMAQMLGLWVKRAPMGINQRRWLSIFIKPIISYLLKKAHLTLNKFSESQMITGIYGIARK